MKLAGRLFLVLLLIVAVVILEFGYRTFIKKEEPTAGIQRESVKIFSFSGAADLAEWQEKPVAKGNTDYSIGEYDGKKCVVAESTDSASTLYYKQRLSYGRCPYVSWEWKAVDFPQRTEPENLSKKKEFDFAAQVYVITDAKFFLNAKALQYVWTESIPAGIVVSNPYTEKVKIIVLESGPTEEWKIETRDICKDYREAFGKELEKDIAAVSFMTDSDSTGTSAKACYTNIEIGYLGKEADQAVSDEKKALPGEPEVKRPEEEEKQDTQMQDI